MPNVLGFQGQWIIGHEIIKLNLALKSYQLNFEAFFYKTVL